MADQPAPLAVQSLWEGSSVVLTLSGDLDMAGIASFWKAASKAFQKGSGALIIDASGLKACDGAGIAVLLDLKRRQAQRGQGFEIRGFPQAYQPLLHLVDAEDATHPEQTKPAQAWIRRRGRRCHRARLQGCPRSCGLCGGSVCDPGHILDPSPEDLWKDAFLIFEKAGVNAVPIVSLVGFLLGLILAFQTAIPLRRFGGTCSRPASWP